MSSMYWDTDCIFYARCDTDGHGKGHVAQAVEAVWWLDMPWMD